MKSLGIEINKHSEAITIFFSILVAAMTLTTSVFSESSEAGHAVAMVFAAATGSYLAAIGVKVNLGIKNIAIVSAFSIISAYLGFVVGDSLSNLFH